MKKVAIIFMILICCRPAAVLATPQPILLSLPESTVAHLIQQSLPFGVNQNSEVLSGVIAVERIDNLDFKDGALTAEVMTSGRDVQLTTSVGGHQIKLNVGTVELEFSLSAAVRFDRDSQTLFVRPQVTGHEQKEQQNKEVGELIMALFNDQEIPLSLASIEPIVTDLGTRELFIDLSVEEVMIKDNSVEILVSPQTSVKDK